MINSFIQNAPGIVGLIFALLASNAWAYGHHDVTQIVRTIDGPKGPRYQIDTGVVNVIIDDLSRHADNYPPRFSDPQERQRATQDAAKLSGMLDILTKSGSSSTELLLNVARLNAMGHNLDIPATAQRADAAYRELLTQQPEHPKSNYGYGLFLASTGRSKAALPYLEKAMAKGVDAASYTLGLVYLSLNDKRKAQALLISHAKAYPMDKDCRGNS